MRHLHLDAFSGVSGDMLLGALLDVGGSEKVLRREWEKLKLPPVEVEIQRVERNGIGATQVHFNVPHEHHHRAFSEIRARIESSDLTEFVKEKSLSMFHRLAEVEAKIHNTQVEEVHFHEVGAIDSILDLVGIVILMEDLRVDSVSASTIPTGTGWTESQHGKIPVPAPATAELLIGIPTYPGPVASELTTPTGAAFLATQVSGFGAMRDLCVEKIGYGAGQKKFEHPNLLRVFLGDSKNESKTELKLIETTLDDMTPEQLPYVVDRLLGAGAQDAFYAPIHMKKGRAGFQLTVLCDESELAALVELVFKETTAIGLRIESSQKIMLEREDQLLLLPEGEVHVKVSRRGGVVYNAKPEFEDCRRIAESRGIPLKEVYRQVWLAMNSLKT